jgi:hypothetical protein
MSTPVYTSVAATALLLLLSPAADATDAKAVRDACRREAVKNHIDKDAIDEHVQNCADKGLNRTGRGGDPESDTDPEPFTESEVEFAPEGDQEPAPVE